MFGRLQRRCAGISSSLLEPIRMLLDDIRETTRPDSTNRRKKAPSVRLPQMSPVSLISLLYAVSMYIFYRQDFIGGLTFISVVAAVLAVAIGFHGVFRLGFNLRFQEPSLMLPQLLAA